MHFYGPKPKPTQQIVTTNSVVQTDSAVSTAANAVETATKASEGLSSPVSGLSKYAGKLTETILSNNLVTFTF